MLGFAERVTRAGAWVARSIVLALEALGNAALYPFRKSAELGADLCHWVSQDRRRSMVGAVLVLALGPMAGLGARASLEAVTADVSARTAETLFFAIADEEPSSQFFAVARPLPSQSVQLASVEKFDAMQIATGRVPSGGVLGEILTGKGATAGRVAEITAALQPLGFDFKYAKEGDFYALVQNDSGDFVSFEYQQGRDLYRVSPSPGGKLIAVHSEPPMERRVVTLGGVVVRSVFDSLRDQGERPELVQDFADIFAWTFDFTTETRPGDEYRLVYEKFYDRGGFVRYGNILAAQYISNDRDLAAVYYEDSSGLGGYYTPSGRSVRGSLLRAPVKYTRISSTFAAKRLHPVHQVWKPHYAVDYAAPTGTPVWAAGDGRVTFKGRLGGLGRAVKIRHPNGYVSIYGHLSRFSRDIKVGSIVQQKQVIGYVGQSGTATGPHLDYRLKYDNKYVDPLKVRFESTRAIQTDDYERFSQVKAERLAKLREADPALVLEAAM